MEKTNAERFFFQSLGHWRTLSQPHCLSDLFQILRHGHIDGNTWNGIVCVQLTITLRIWPQRRQSDMFQTLKHRYIDSNLCCGRDKTSCFSGVSQNPAHKHITEKTCGAGISTFRRKKPDQHVLQWGKTVFESQRQERDKILFNRIGNAKRRNRESVRKENSLSTMYRSTTPPRPRTPDRQLISACYRRTPRKEVGAHSPHPPPLLHTTSLCAERDRAQRRVGGDVSEATSAPLTQHSWQVQVRQDSHQIISRKPSSHSEHCV